MNYIPVLVIFPLLFALTFLIQSINHRAGVSKFDRAYAWLRWLMGIMFVVCLFILLAPDRWIRVVMP